MRFLLKFLCASRMPHPAPGVKEIPVQGAEHGHDENEEWLKRVKESITNIFK